MVIRGVRICCGLRYNEADEFFRVRVEICHLAPSFAGTNRAQPQQTCRRLSPALSDHSSQESLATLVGMKGLCERGRSKGSSLVSPTKQLRNKTEI